MGLFSPSFYSLKKKKKKQGGSPLHHTPIMVHIFGPESPHAYFKW